MPLDDRQVVLGIAQRIGEALTNLLDALGIVADRCAIGVQHDVGVEGELAAGGDDAGVVDVQVELVHRRHRHGEEVVLVGGIDEYLRATLEFVLGGFLDQYQRLAAVAVPEDRLGMPGHVGR